MSLNLKEFTKGIIKENPVLVLLLGMCPTLATTSSGINGLSMGIATTFVLLGSNIVVSLLRKLIPDTVRIPAFIVIIATFVTVVQLVMEAYAPPALNEALGIFIPLIVVNCIILGRAEAFAAKNPVLPSILDALGMGLGFTLGLTTLGSIREILGSGSLFGWVYVPEDLHILGFVLAPGAFLVLGTMIAILQFYKQKGAKA